MLRDVVTILCITIILFTAAKLIIAAVSLALGIG